jgi:hypothetical protein
LTRLRDGGWPAGFGPLALGQDERIGTGPGRQIAPDAL